MKDEKLLNIIKDYFQENFELVDTGYEGTKPITSSNSQGMFGKITSISPNDMVIGEFTLDWLSLDIDKFQFKVIKNTKRMFNIHIPAHDYSESKHRYSSGGHVFNTDNTQITEYEVNIHRKSEIYRALDGILLTKTIIVDEDYYDKIKLSIEYNETKMSEELTELLGDLRNKKIDKLTKEE